MQLVNLALQELFLDIGLREANVLVFGACLVLAELVLGLGQLGLQLRAGRGGRSGSGGRRGGRGLGGGDLELQ